MTALVVGAAPAAARFAGKLAVAARDEELRLLLGSQLGAASELKDADGAVLVGNLDELQSFEDVARRRGVKVLAKIFAGANSAMATVYHPEQVGTRETMTIVLAKRWLQQPLSSFPAGAALLRHIHPAD